MKPITYNPQLATEIGLVSAIYLQYLYEADKEIEVDFKQLSTRLGIPKVQLHKAHMELAQYSVILSNYSEDTAPTSHFKVRINKVFMEKLLAKTAQNTLEESFVKITWQSKSRFLRDCLREENNNGSTKIGRNKSLSTTRKLVRS